MNQETVLSKSISLEDTIKLYKVTLLSSLGFYFNMKISPTDKEKKFIKETSERSLKLRKSIKCKHTIARLNTQDRFKDFINCGDWVIGNNEINIKDLLRLKSVTFEEVKIVNDEVYKYCLSKGELIPVVYKPN